MIICSMFPPRDGRRARYVAPEHFNRAERFITRNTYRVERKFGTDRGLATWRALEAGNRARRERTLAARFGTRGFGSKAGA